MDEALHNEERILRYLDGLMKPEEQKAFETELQQNSALRRQTEDLRLSIGAVKMYGIREKVAAVHKEVINEVSPARRKGKVVPFKKFIRYSLSAAAILFLVFLSYQAYVMYHLSPEKLYQESYVAYQPSSTTRGTAGEVSSIQKSYTDRDYNSVISSSKRSESGLTEKDRLLVALSYLESNQLSGAIKRLEALSREAHTYQQDAEYYLALSYLRNEDYDKSLELMRKIRDDETHLYHQQFSNAYIRKVKLLKWK